MSTTITYHGWSSLAVESPEGKLVFDPFWRSYCGAHWFGPEAFDGASVICVTHGHEEHFLDTPDVVRRTGATVVAGPAVCNFLRKRSRIPDRQLVPPGPHHRLGATVTRLETVLDDLDAALAAH